jgi:hypothetical protein
MTDGLILSILRRNPDVDICRLDEGQYFVKFGEQAWLFWTTSSRWVEVDPESRDERLGDMHYGPIAVFYEKCIKRRRDLPINHGKLWVEEDIDSLYELIEEDESIQQIAEKMGRSVSSIVAKTGSLLGYDFSHLNTSKGMDELTFSKLMGDSDKSPG